MSRIRPLFVLTTLLCLAPTAQAGDKAKMPHVVNCTGHDMLVCAYNGNDSFGAAASWSTVMHDGESARLRCDGNGTQRCKVAMMGARGGATCSNAATRNTGIAEFKSTYWIQGSGDDAALQLTDLDERDCSSNN